MKPLDDIIRNLKVLITGANGFVGQHVVNIGRQHGADIHAFCRKKVSIDGAKVWIGDLTKREEVFSAVTKIKPDVILHLAASGVSYGASTAPELLKENGVGLGNLLESLVSLGTAPKTVIAGSGFEYAPLNRPLIETDILKPNTAYGVSKASATLLAGLYAKRLPITILRLFSIYGPGEADSRLIPYIITKTLRGEPVDLTPGEQLRDYTYIEDVAEVFWRVLSSPPPTGEMQIINIGSGEIVTLKAFALKLNQILKQQGFKPEFNFGARTYRDDEMMVYCPDISLMKSKLNLVPATDLNTGLRKMVEAYICDQLKK